MRKFIVFTACFILLNVTNTDRIFADNISPGVNPSNAENSVVTGMKDDCFPVVYKDFYYTQNNKYTIKDKLLQAKIDEDVLKSEIVEICYEDYYISNINDWEGGCKDSDGSIISIQHRKNIYDKIIPDDVNKYNGLNLPKKNAACEYNVRARYGYLANGATATPGFLVGYNDTLINTDGTVKAGDMYGKHDRYSYGCLFDPRCHEAGEPGNYLSGKYKNTFYVEYQPESDKDNPLNVNMIVNSQILTHVIRDRMAIDSGRFERWSGFGKKNDMYIKNILSNHNKLEKRGYLSAVKDIDKKKIQVTLKHPKNFADSVNDFTKIMKYDECLDTNPYHQRYMTPSQAKSIGKMAIDFLEDYYSYFILNQNDYSNKGVEKKAKKQFYRALVDSIYFLHLPYVVKALSSYLGGLDGSNGGHRLCNRYTPYGTNGNDGVFMTATELQSRGFGDPDNYEEADIHKEKYCAMPLEENKCPKFYLSSDKDLPLHNQYQRNDKGAINLDTKNAYYKVKTGGRCIFVDRDDNRVKKDVNYSVKGVLGALEDLVSGRHSASSWSMVAGGSVLGVLAVGVVGVGALTTAGAAFVMLTILGTVPTAILLIDNSGIHMPDYRESIYWANFPLLLRYSFMDIKLDDKFSKSDDGKKHLHQGNAVVASNLFCLPGDSETPPIFPNILGLGNADYEMSVMSDSFKIANQSVNVIYELENIRNARKLCEKQSQQRLYNNNIKCTTNDNVTLQFNSSNPNHLYTNEFLAKYNNNNDTDLDAKEIPTDLKTFTVWDYKYDKLLVYKYDLTQNTDAHKVVALNFNNVDNFVQDDKNNHYMIMDDSTNNVDSTGVTTLNNINVDQIGNAGISYTTKEHLNGLRTSKFFSTQEFSKPGSKTDEKVKFIEEIGKKIEFSRLNPYKTHFVTPDVDEYGLQFKDQNNFNITNKDKLCNIWKNAKTYNVAHDNINCTNGNTLYPIFLVYLKENKTKEVNGEKEIECSRNSPYFILNKNGDDLSLKEITESFIKVSDLEEYVNDSTNPTPDCTVKKENIKSATLYGLTNNPKFNIPISSVIDIDQGWNDNNKILSCFNYHQEIASDTNAQINRDTDCNYKPKLSLHTTYEHKAADNNRIDLSILQNEISGNNPHSWIRVSDISAFSDIKNDSYPPLMQCVSRDLVNNENITDSLDKLGLCTPYLPLSKSCKTINIKSADPSVDNHKIRIINPQSEWSTDENMTISISPEDLQSAAFKLKFDTLGDFGFTLEDLKNSKIIEDISTLNWKGTFKSYYKSNNSLGWYPMGFREEYLHHEQNHSALYYKDQSQLDDYCRTQSIIGSNNKLNYSTLYYCGEIIDTKIRYLFEYLNSLTDTDIKNFSIKKCKDTFSVDNGICEYIIPPSFTYEGFPLIMANDIYTYVNNYYYNSGTFRDDVHKHCKRDNILSGPACTLAVAMRYGYISFSSEYFWPTRSINSEEWIRPFGELMYYGMKPFGDEEFLDATYREVYVPARKILQARYPFYSMTSAYWKWVPAHCMEWYTEDIDRDVCSIVYVINARYPNGTPTDKFRGIKFLQIRHRDDNATDSVDCGEGKTIYGKRYCIKNNACPPGKDDISASEYNGYDYNILDYSVGGKNYSPNQCVYGSAVTSGNQDLENIVKLLNDASNEITIKDLKIQRDVYIHDKMPLQLYIDPQDAERDEIRIATNTPSTGSSNANIAFHDNRNNSYSGALYNHDLAEQLNGISLTVNPNSKYSDYITSQDQNRITLTIEDDNNPNLKYEDMEARVCVYNTIP